MKTFNDLPLAHQKALVQEVNQTLGTNILYNAEKGDIRRRLRNGSGRGSSAQDFVEVGVESLLDFLVDKSSI